VAAQRRLLTAMQKTLACEQYSCVFGNGEVYKVEFSTSPELNSVATALTAALAELGGTLKHMGAPRKSSERAAADALRALSQ